MVSQLLIPWRMYAPLASHTSATSIKIAIVKIRVFMFHSYFLQIYRNIILSEMVGYSFFFTQELKGSWTHKFYQNEGVKIPILENFFDSLLISMKSKRFNPYLAIWRELGWAYNKGGGQLMVSSLCGW